MAWHACLLLVLLLAQNAGVRHELTHLLGGGDPDHASVLHPDVCQDCLAHAAVAHTATGGSPPAVLPLPWTTEAPRRVDGPAPRSFTLANYRARAPPMNVDA